MASKSIGAIRKAVVLADESSRRKKVFCLLCTNVYQEPYIASCGHTFCQECVTKHDETLCPTDGKKLSLLVKNLAVAEEVADLNIHCHYGCVINDDNSQEADLQGCPAVLKLGNREEHEDSCDYAPTVCPNCTLCPPVLRKDLEKHLAICGHQRCINYKYRCPFQGTKEQVEAHAKSCQFGGVKGAVDKLEADFVAVCEQVEGHTEQIKQISSTVQKNMSQMEVVNLSTTQALQKIARLEEQQGFILKEIALVQGNISTMLSEVKNVQQQLGLSGSIEAQHLFKCQGTFVGHKGPVWALCRSGSYLISASSDNSVKVWNLNDIYVGPKTLAGHEGIVLALCCQADQLFSGSSDNSIKVWSIKSHEIIRSFKAHDEPVCTLACNESYLFSGSLKSIKVWNLPSCELSTSLPTQNHWVRALVVHGNLLYSGSYKAVKIWNIDNFEVVHVLQCTGGSVYSIAVTDKHIICGTYENTIHIWDVGKHREIATLTGHVGSIYALAVMKTPGRVRLFSGSYDKTIRVWNMELMTCAQTMARHEGSVTCLLGFRGSIVSGAVDGTLKFYLTHLMESLWKSIGRRTLKRFGNKFTLNGQL